MIPSHTDVFIHPHALVESDSIGRGTRIWAFAHVMHGAVVGRQCNICDHSFVESKVKIGDGVTIKNGVALWDLVTIEDRVFIGPYAVFTNDRRPRAEVKKGPEAPGRHPGEGRRHRRGKCNHRCRSYYRTVCNDRSGHGRSRGRSRAGNGCRQPCASYRLCLHLRRSAR